MSALQPSQPSATNFANRKLSETMNKIKQKHNIATTTSTAVNMTAPDPKPTTTVTGIASKNTKFPDVVKPKAPAQIKPATTSSSNSSVPKIAPAPAAKKAPARKAPAKSILDADDEELPVLSYVGREILDKDLIADLKNGNGADDDDGKDSDMELDVENDRFEELDDFRAHQLLEQESKRISERRARNPPNQFIESLMAKYCTFDELEGQGFERKIPEKFRLSAEEKARIEAEDAARRLSGQNESSEVSESESEYFDEEEEEDDESESEDEENESSPAKPLPKQQPLLPKSTIPSNNNNNNALPAKPIATNNNNTKPLPVNNNNKPIVTNKPAAPITTVVAPKPVPKAQNDAASSGRSYTLPPRSTRYNGPWKMDEDLVETDEDDSDFTASEDEDDEDESEEIDDAEEDEEESDEEDYEEKKKPAVKRKTPETVQQQSASINSDMKKLKITKP